ncbi:MAG: hypothetical protein WAX89_07535, partial [Alphaproteobacteria bacterium]
AEALLRQENQPHSPYRLAAVCARRPKTWLKGWGVEFSDCPTMLAQKAGIDMVVECMGGVPMAHEVVGAALSAGKHVVTANTALMVSYGHMLQRLAQGNNVFLGFDAAMGGNLPYRALATNLQQPLEKVDVAYGRGLNRVLERMHTMAETYGKALLAVQQEGALDTSGKEDFYRQSLLHTAFFGTWNKLNAAPSLGLENLRPEDFALATQLESTIRVVGTLTPQGITYAPQVLPQTHPLTNAMADALMLHTQSSIGTGPMTMTLPPRTIASTVAALLNDMAAAAHTRTCVALPQRMELATKPNTPQYFVRLPITQHLKLRRDTRFGVVEEKTDTRTGMMAVKLNTLLPRSDLVEILGAEATILAMYGTNVLAQAHNNGHNMGRIAA